MAERLPHHERYDFDARRIAFAGVLLAAALIVIGIALRLALGPPRSAQRDAAFVDDARRNPALQATPRDDLARYRRDKQARLESYGWIDRSAGIAHIPIERAMQLAAQRAPQEPAP